MYKITKVNGNKHAINNIILNNVIICFLEQHVKNHIDIITLLVLLFRVRFNLVLLFRVRFNLIQ